MDRQAVIKNRILFPAISEYPSLLVGENTMASFMPIPLRIFLNNGAYWPNRQGPDEVGMKKAWREGSNPGLWITDRKSPNVTRWGRHSSPVTKRDAEAKVLSSDGGATRASTPADRNAAAIASAPAVPMRGM